MKYYPALLHKDDLSEYGVSFPDFPGCIGAGATAQAAVDDAFCALRTHMEIRVADGEAMPEPSDLEAVLADPAAMDGMLVMVPSPRVASKVLRVNITVPEADLSAFDAFASLSGLTRSGLIVTATRLYVQERTGAVEPDEAEPTTGTNNVTVLFRGGTDATRRT